MELATVAHHKSYALESHFCTREAGVRKLIQLQHVIGTRTGCSKESYKWKFECEKGMVISKLLVRGVNCFVVDHLVESGYSWLQCDTRHCNWMDLVTYWEVRGVRRV